MSRTEWLGVALALALALTAVADQGYAPALAAAKPPATAHEARAVLAAVERGWPQPAGRLEALAQANAQAVELLRKAVAAEPGAFAPSPDPFKPAPHLGPATQLAQIALLEARRLQAQGDAPAAARLCVTVAAFGQDVARKGPLASWWTGHAIQDAAATLLADLAQAVAGEEARSPRSDAGAMEALAALGRRDPALKDAVEAERRQVVAALHAVRAALKTGGVEAVRAQGLDVDSPDGRILVEAAKSLGPEPAQWPLVQRLDALLAVCGRPMAELRSNTLLDPAVADKTEDPLVRILWPGVRNAIVGAECGRARRLMALTAVAVAQAKRRGETSHALEVLLKGLVSPMPLDPFTGFPFQCVFVEGGFFLYSLGPDGADSQARREIGPGMESGDLALWVPRRSAFVWKVLTPELERLRADKTAVVHRWNPLRPNEVFVASAEGLAVGSADDLRLARCPWTSLAPGPLETRDMAFDATGAWLATNGGLFRYDTRRRRWAPAPLPGAAGVDCLAVRMDGATLDLLAGPAGAEQVFHLKAGQWSAGARETAQIWAANLAGRR